MELQLMDGLDWSVKEVLLRHVGEANAITRADLLTEIRRRVTLDGATDRQVRLAIEALREKGLLVCNVLTGDGYYLASNMDEYQAFRRKYSSYAFSILEKVREMDKEASQRWGYSALQESLF